MKQLKSFLIIILAIMATMGCVNEEDDFNESIIVTWVYLPNNDVSVSFKESYYGYIDTGIDLSNLKGSLIEQNADLNQSKMIPPVPPPTDRFQWTMEGSKLSLIFETFETSYAVSGDYYYVISDNELVLIYEDGTSYDLRRLEQ